MQPLFVRVRRRGSDKAKSERMGYLSYRNTFISYTPIWSQPQYFVPYVPLLQETGDQKNENYPNSGGPFFSQRIENTFSDGIAMTGANYLALKNTGLSTYLGKIRVYDANCLNNNLISYDAYDRCKSYGPTGWARYKPAQPNVSMSQFIYELKDYPQQAFRKIKQFRTVGSNYLAYQFGWKPFLSDLDRWFTSIKHVDRRIAQLKSDQGKWIKRGGPLAFESDTVTNSLGTGFDAWLGPYGGIKVHGTRSVVESERVWFSGRFRYYIPGLNDSKLGKFRAIRKLWGLDITPEVVYNLVPWSWLFDWFSNLGDVISNFTSAIEDNLVSKYAYCMLEHKITTTLNAQVATEVYEGTYPMVRTYHNLQHQHVRHTKTRVPASPFGFNLTPDGLTIRQGAILSALGISRLKF